MKNRQPSLTTRQLDVGYKSGKVQRIIGHALNLTLLPGRLVCLLGPNGAGKSTLLRTLSGLQPPLSGEIYLGKDKLSSLAPPELAQRMSLVLSERVETGNLNVTEVVSLGRTPYTGWFGKLSTKDREKIIWSMEVTGIMCFRDEPLSQLSDGEKQKVLLARALAQDTEIILLDEPTAHLDLPSRVEIMHLLRQLARDTSKAVLLSTHELDLALQVADQLWLVKADGYLAQGVPEHMVLDGTFEDVFSGRGVFFDKSAGLFKTQSHAVRFDVALSGPRELALWTSKALLREGVGCSDASPRYKIEIQDQPNTLWVITHGQTRQYCTSLEELLNTIQLLEDSTQPGTFE
jgi:iron complex transport system ATP-binding protein